MIGALRFISSNESKILEYRELLKPVMFTPLQIAVRETFADEPRVVVRQKLLQAYELKRAPLFVDHTGLYINALGGMPGSFSQLFWERLGPEGILSLMACKNDRRALARTTIGYCDGRLIHIFEGELKGTISMEPRGCAGSWVCLFTPEGFDLTIGEMTLEQKNSISQRRLAADKFKAHLLNPGGGISIER